MGWIGRLSARWFDLDGVTGEIPRWNVNLCYPCFIITKSSDGISLSVEIYVDYDCFMGWKTMWDDWGRTFGDSQRENILLVTILGNIWVIQRRQHVTDLEIPLMNG